jgi:hypothetical protein
VSTFILTYYAKLFRSFNLMLQTHEPQKHTHSTYIHFLARFDVLSGVHLPHTCIIYITARLSFLPEPALGNRPHFNFLKEKSRTANLSSSSSSLAAVSGFNVGQPTNQLLIQCCSPPSCSSPTIMAVAICDGPPPLCAL